MALGKLAPIFEILFAGCGSSVLRKVGPPSAL